MRGVGVEQRVLWPCCDCGIDRYANRPEAIAELRGFPTTGGYCNEMAVWHRLAQEAGEGVPDALAPSPFREDGGVRLARPGQAPTAPLDDR